MATITGARGTTLISTSQRITNMDRAIKLLVPDETPFTTFLQQLRKNRTGDPKFQGLEDDLEPRFDAVNNGAGYASGATSVVVDNGAYFAEHDLVSVTRTAEIMRVTGVSTNTLTVVRGQGGSTAAALVDNDELAILGSAQPEGDTARPARSTNGTALVGYTQIFRNTYELTETAVASENQTTPHDWDHQKKKTGIEHKRSIERSFLFNSTGAEDTSGSQPRRLSRGLIASITTNSTDAGGALTEAEFNTFMRSVFRYGSKRKLLMAAPLVTSVLNTFGAGKVQVSQKETVYGVDFTTYTGPFGALRLVTNWELEGTKYGGYAVAVDLDNVAYRWLGNDKRNRDTKTYEDIQAPGTDTSKGEWKSEVGLEVSMQRTHGLLVGVTG